MFGDFKGYYAIVTLTSEISTILWHDTPFNDGKQMCIFFV
jgi:hypothetical protein